MASNLKVDIVKPTATNGSLSLKGDSGGSATSNGISVDSSGNTSITGTTTIATADINGGNIDDTTIGGTTPAVGSFTQVNADNIRLDGNAILSTNLNGTINLSPNGDGNVTVVTSSIRLSSGYGIEFHNYGLEESPDNTATDVTSNLLNDYEEGTWTGTLKGGTTDPTTPVTVTGYYTKVGRFVELNIIFSNVDTTGASGTVSVTGVPFDALSIGIGTVGTYNFDFNGGTSLFSYISGTTIYFLGSRDDNTWIELAHSAGTTRYLWLSVSYIV